MMDFMIFTYEATPETLLTLVVTQAFQALISKALNLWHITNRATNRVDH